MMISPASSQETSDAPPAAFAAVSAPSNQPEPMMEPSEMNINDVRPTLRRRPAVAPLASAGFDTSDTTHLRSGPSGPIRSCCARRRRPPSADRVITGCDSVKPL
jgi:hypothetical protein